MLKSVFFFMFMSIFMKKISNFFCDVRKKHTLRQKSQRKGRTTTGF